MSRSYVKKLGKRAMRFARLALKRDCHWADKHGPHLHWLIWQRKRLNICEIYSIVEPLPAKVTHLNEFQTLTSLRWPTQPGKSLRKAA